MKEIGNKTPLSDRFVPDNSHPSTSETTAIPFGTWEIGSGQWKPNVNLDLSGAAQHNHNLQHGFSCIHYLNPLACIECPPAAIDTPIRFSHVRARIQAPILCPDCDDSILYYEVGAHTLHCGKCGERFQTPTIGLERTPSEDYTSPDPNG